MKRKSNGLKSKKTLNGVLLWRKKSGLAGLNIPTTHVQIRRCLSYMAKNYDEPIQLKDVMKISGMQRRGFLKAFNKNTGVNPGALLRHIRVEHAKRLLVEQDLALKKIAKKCGYRSENTFCVAFQRATMMAPKKFQRQYWLAMYRNQHSRGILTMFPSPLKKRPL